MKLTFPYNCVGSVRTEVKDAATSEQSRIAAAATISHGRRNVETQWTAAAAAAGDDDAATSYNTDTWGNGTRQNVLHLPSRILSAQQAIPKFWMSQLSITVFGTCRRDWKAMVG